MKNDGESWFKQLVTDRWISWVLELTALGITAGFTIYEVRKTNDEIRQEIHQSSEQLREMMARYDQAVAGYAKEKADALDDKSASALANAKQKLESFNLGKHKDKNESEQKAD